MTCATVRIVADTYATVSTSRRSASTSSPESLELEPHPALAPEDVVVPGKIMRKFVPRDLSWFSACRRAPSPIPIVATTHATPMMMPSAVSSERSLLRESARNATFRMFPVFVMASLLPWAAGRTACRLFATGTSERTFPSRNVTIRLACSEMSCSCVMRTTVFPSSFSS